MKIDSDGLKDRHCTGIPKKVVTKRDKAQDIRLIFTDQITINFNSTKGTRTEMG